MIDDEISSSQQTESLHTSIKKLATTSPEESQTILNNIFTEDRREALVSQSSEDNHDRKVRYYREMSQDMLLVLLEKGSLDKTDHFGKDRDSMLRGETVDSPPDSKSLLELLNRHGRANLDGLITDTSEIDRVATDSQFRLVILNKFFPNANEAELNTLVQNWNYKTFIPFLERNLPDKFLKQMHTGSTLPKYSPYMSTSVGGPNHALTDRRVVVELVITDEQVIPNEFGLTGEKEVFIRQIKASQVARVFATDKQLTSEVLENPTTQIGDYNLNVYSKLPEEERSSTNLIEDWRWNEPTVNCLPKSKSGTYIHKGK